MKVVKKFVGDFAKQLSKKKIEIELSEDAEKWLLKRGFDPLLGARPMARTIDDNLKKPLVDELLFGRLEKGGHVKIGVNSKDDTLTFDY